MARLGHTEAHCVALFAPVPGPVTPSAIPTLSPLAQESLQGYVMLLSGHFQGFCRDLYTECSQICAAAVSAGLRRAIQRQFAAELKLNTGNPSVENIRHGLPEIRFPPRSGWDGSGQSAQDHPSRTPELLEKCRGPSESYTATARHTGDSPLGRCSG